MPQGMKVLREGNDLVKLKCTGTQIYQNVKLAFMRPVSTLLLSHNIEVPAITHTEPNRAQFSVHVFPFAGFTNQRSEAAKDRLLVSRWHE